MDEAYNGFVELALMMRRRGRKRWSARGIIHVLRWNTAIADKDKVFKINNNNSKLWAERAMREYPELAGFFNTRES